MENEYIEEFVPEVQGDSLENTENMEIPTENVLPSMENMEEIQETTDKLFENEIGGTVTIVGSNNETYVDMNDGSEDFYDSLSDNDISYEDIMDSSTEHTYVTNVYEIVEEEEIPLWESDISELGRTDTLLLLIFLLLLVQFIHNIFKGSHWFKG